MRNLFRKEPRYITVPGVPVPKVQGEARTAPGAGADRTADGPVPSARVDLWVRCENERCRELLYVREFENNLKVCHKCEHHARLKARERITQLVDGGSFC